MIDVDAASLHGVAVANTPTYCIDEVATHALAMTLALTRGLKSYDQAVRAGRWQATAGSPKVVRPAATSVLVIGFGRIGSAVARAPRRSGTACSCTTRSSTTTGSRSMAIGRCRSRAAFGRPTWSASTCR